jgi:serine/threonine-protein kinase
MASVPSETFVEILFRNGLLEGDARDELAGLQERFPEPRALAQELMRRGHLTPYQVNQLFLGRASELVFGPYILLERLGEGGMGQIFKARQRNLNRVVALKVIRKEFLSHPRALPRFHREIQAAAQLSHPNIIRAFDAGEVDGTYFFTMEFVDGIDLDRMVRQSGPLRVEQACDYVRQAALGLDHAHQRGLVHRDIKPANLLIARPPVAAGASLRSGVFSRPTNGAAPWGVVKILDLGLARMEDAEQTHLTQLGALMGTPDYLAPEQARNCHTSDIRADLYSLGCTFYHLLSGRPPFPSGSVSDKLLAHQTREPDPAEQVRREKLLRGVPTGEETPVLKLVTIPGEVTFVLSQLLAKRPQDRCQTPAELAAALTTWLKRRLGAGFGQGATSA